MDYSSLGGMSLSSSSAVAEALLAPLDGRPANLPRNMHSVAAENSRQQLVRGKTYGLKIRHRATPRGNTVYD